MKKRLPTILGLRPTWLLLWTGASACHGSIGESSDATSLAQDPQPSPRVTSGTSGSSPSAVAGPTSAPDPASCTSAPGRPRLRRLTRSEYDRTMLDLLGIDAKLGQNFAADPVQNGFDNAADELQVSPLLAQQISAAADTLAGLALPHLASLLACVPRSKSDIACLAQSFAQLAPKAFRRSLSRGEDGPYLQLFQQVAEDLGVDSAMASVLSALLQSPHFLYRRELGEADGAGDSVLTDEEIASELSYTLTGSMPDDELLGLARAHTLHTPEQIHPQTRRLLHSPRGAEQVARFVGSWLDLGQLSSVPKDATAYPLFTDEVRAAMAGETDRFVGYVVQESSGTLRELLTAPYTFANPTLANFYGLDASSAAHADGYTKLAFGSSTRAGILGQGAFLATHAKPTGSSPIHRGKAVRERLLCSSLPPPPANIKITPPAVDSTKTNRERFAQHDTDPLCAGCHRLMDPIGFGFEALDGVGRVLATDNGREVDARGEILSSSGTDGTFDGEAQLSEKLAGSPEVAGCFTEQWIRFAYGLSDTSEIACLTARAQRSFATGSGEMEALLLELTASSHFLTRREP